MWSQFCVAFDMKILPLIVFAMCVSVGAQAQIYKSTFGLRFDDEQLGFSFTQRVLPTVSVEAFLDLEKTEIRSGAVIRPHLKLAGKRLNWYPMAGAFVTQRRQVGSAWGVLTGIGAEYKFMLAPVVISFDVVPHIYLTQDFPDYFNFQTVFSVKYILVKDKRFKLPTRDSDEQ